MTRRAHTVPNRAHVRKRETATTQKGSGRL